MHVHCTIVRILILYKYPQTQMKCNFNVLFTIIHVLQTGAKNCTNT